LQTLLSSFVSVPRAIDAFLRRQELAAERIQTGQRINRPADDAAAFSLALSLQSAVRIKKQAILNIRDGLTYLDTLESALRDWGGRLARINETAARNGSPGQQAAVLQREFDASGGEVQRLFTSAHGAPGSALPNKGPVLQIGGDTSTGNRFDLGQELNLESLDPRSLALPSALAGTGASGADTIGPLDKALQAVSRNLGRVAAVRGRLARIESNLAQSAQNLQDAEIRITAADLAEETAEFAASGIRAQTALAVFIQGHLFRQTVARLLLS
jgi:flagellin